MRLRDIAHSRAGDKGTIINCSVIPYDERDYDWLVSVVTAERVRAHMGTLIEGDVQRFLAPGVAAMNFVMSRPSGQSVTRTLALDAHGKSFSSALLEMEIPERAAIGPMG
jgi:hypothetical protein